MEKIFLIRVGLHKVFRKGKNSLIGFISQEKLTGVWRFSIFLVILILPYIHTPDFKALHFLIQGLYLNMRNVVRLVRELILWSDNSQDLSWYLIFSNLSIYFGAYQPCFIIERRFFKNNHRNSLVLVHDMSWEFRFQWDYSLSLNSPVLLEGPTLPCSLCILHAFILFLRNSPCVSQMPCMK